MSITVTDEQARRLRVRAQRLDPEFSTAPDVSQVVKEVAGLQAQDMSAATLGVRVRSTGSVAADVHRARIEDRSVVRTWCMRNTLHLVAADDLAWMMPVFQPAFLPANRRRRAQLGLDDETLTRGVAGLVGLLASNGPQTRSEIVAGLAPHGIYLAGQAAPHLIAYAALAGKVCQGPDRGREPTYVRLEDWLTPPKAVSRETALGELARRYLAAYGPAPVSYTHLTLPTILRV